MSLMEQQQRMLRRTLWWVAAAHGLLLLMMMFMPGFHFIRKPEPQVTWISAGQINVKGDMGMDKYGGDAVKSTGMPPPPAPVTDPVPAVAAPTPAVTPKPVVTSPPPTPVVEAPRPVEPVQPAVPTPSDLNIRKPDIKPKPVTVPPKVKPTIKPSTKVVARQDGQTDETASSDTPPSKPVIKPGRLVERGSAANGTSGSGKGSSSRNANPSPNGVPGGTGLAGAADRLGRGGGVKSGLTTGSIIGVSGVPGGADGDFGDYLVHVRDVMRSRWNQPGNLVNGTRNYVTGIRIHIARDGTISQESIARGSGSSEWDESALAAARKAARLNPLPVGLGDAGGLTITVNFEKDQ